MTFPAGLFEAFETARHSIFRLETHQFYAGDPNYDRWVAGEPWQDTESKGHWCDLVRRRTSEGVSMQRVHIVEEPLSNYVRFELEWSYPPNVEAGEDVRIGVWADRRPSTTDFWLFDNAKVWAMQYDDEGKLLRVEQMVTSNSLDWARLHSGVALATSVPLAQYMAPA